MTAAKGAGREGIMEFGVHLPLLAFRGQAFSLSRLVDYAETAEQLGFTTLCANDHLITSRPWLDSLTALASILTKTPHMTLMTTVALPVVRGPVPLAKSLDALDVLSGGHLIAGVGPGSSPQDYALAAIAFEERWKRFDESIQLLRSLLQRVHCLTKIFRHLPLTLSSLPFFRWPYKTFLSAFNSLFIRSLRSCSVSGCGTIDSASTDTV